MKTTNLTDNELLRSMLAGDEEALTVLYRRRHDGVYRFALQMCGSRAVAEDVTQEVFLFLIKEGHVFDPSRGALQSFLIGVARNYMLRRLRGDQDLVSIGDEAESMFESVTAEPGLLEDLTRAETVEAVRRAVLSLPHRYREVVVLCELQEMSYVEAASVLNCAIGTVRSRLHRARALLTQKLKPAAYKKDIESANVKSARCFA